MIVVDVFIDGNFKNSDDCKAQIPNAQILLDQLGREAIAHLIEHHNRLKASEDRIIELCHTGK